MSPEADPGKPGTDKTGPSEAEPDVKPPRLRRVLSFRVLPALVVLAVSMASCNSKNSEVIPEVPSGNNPNVVDNRPRSELQRPVALFDGKQVVLEKETDPLSRAVSLVNADAELAPGNGLIDSNSSGFVATGNCYYRDTQLEAASENWRFELDPGCSLTQFSDQSLDIDSAVSVVFDVAGMPGSAARLLVEILLMDESGALNVLASREFIITAEANAWQARQLSIGYQSNVNPGAQTLGLRFNNTATAAPVSIDNIVLETHSPPVSADIVFTDNWENHCEQLWAGQYYWSNRLHDWQLTNGQLQTRNPSTHRPNRTTHRISTVVSSVPGDFSLKIDTGVADKNTSGAYSGFLLGAGGRMDYRSAALIHNRPGRNGGLIVGIDAEGRALIMDHGIKRQRLANGAASNASAGATLQLDAVYREDGDYDLNVFVMDTDGSIISTTYAQVDAARLLGNIAVVSNPGSGGSAHWFDNWTGVGPKLREMASRQFGPVLFASYTVSQSTLTLNAQYPPLCSDQIPEPTLQVMRDGGWTEVSSSRIDPESYTARFQVENWDASDVVRYRVATQIVQQGVSETLFYEGAVQAEPLDDAEFVIGVYNCRPGLINSASEGWIQQNSYQPFTWTRDRIVFPHEELLENSQQHELDMVTFLGDQIYEFDPNGLIEQDPAEVIHDYLWKWYQFGWSAREIMRNLPTFLIPDDHDVYQGNIWGQSGIVAQEEAEGGYIYPASFVNVVTKTQTGSLPTAFDPTPVAQGINVYYTDMVYGGVGMAVLEDRKFKSGPNSSARPRELLGDRQVEFLEQWSSDWRDQSMKLVISQSPFSQSTTHSGKDFARNKLDQDSNGWPKSGRDEAVNLLRKSFSPHIAGDQHLGMSLQHGIDQPADAVYSFAGPSMLNIFARIWDPTNSADGPGVAGTPYLGQYTDAHGNFIDVLAAANPVVYYQSGPQVDKPPKDNLGIGYGIVRVHKPERRYSFEAWPANVAPSSTGALPYPGWPISIDQTDNDGRIPSGYLAARTSAVNEPVVKVFSESDNSLVYARRYTTAQVSLPVFDNSISYRVELSEPETGYQETFEQQRVQ